ncbi:MAG: CHAT domain-containing protein [Xenococcus sp. MO_188.B8]|nr:CHAT domain-containing protein [Xenococcus sp. MO_188.B8]
MLQEFLLKFTQLLVAKLRLIIPKQHRKQLYFVFSGLICFSIIIANSPGVNAQNTSTPELLDTVKLAQTIQKVEAKWEKDYEKYFKRKFFNYNRSAEEIAQHLTDISEQTDIQPAVIWAIPKPKFLQLLLVTPQSQLVMKEIRSADNIALDRIVNQFTSAIADRQSTRYLPPAKQLYRWIFAPLESYLEAENIDTILLCTGPKLRSLPFAALHDGEQFVIEKYNLALIPAFNFSGLVLP